MLRSEATADGISHSIVMREAPCVVRTIDETIMAAVSANADSALPAIYFGEI